MLQFGVITQLRCFVFGSSHAFFIPGAWRFVSLDGEPAHSRSSSFTKSSNSRSWLVGLSRVQRFHSYRLGAVAAGYNCLNAIGA